MVLTDTPLKVHLLSDLHLEFSKWPRAFDINAIDADVTVLAGDISVGLAGLEWALRIERPVVYVMGNHEFYGQRPMSELWEKARKKVAGTQIRLLENESTEINGVRFLGSTLWTDFCLYGSDAQQEMMQHALDGVSDFQAINIEQHGTAIWDEMAGYMRHSGKQLTPARVAELYSESVEFLEAALHDKGTSPAPKTVVVTHFAPHPQCIPPQFEGSDLSPAFVSDLSRLVRQKQIDAWCFGHTHGSLDLTLEGQCRLVSNQRGYPGEITDGSFQPDFVFEI